MPCWRMTERTGEGFLDERGLSEGAKVADACFRRVGIEDIEVEDACRTVTGLLSLLDALRGASWASAMAAWEFVVEFDQGFLDRSHNGQGICMLCLRRSVCVVLATDLAKCRSESEIKSKRATTSQVQMRGRGRGRCLVPGGGSRKRPRSSKPCHNVAAKMQPESHRFLFLVSALRSIFWNNLILL